MPRLLLKRFLIISLPLTIAVLFLNVTLAQGEDVTPPTTTYTITPSSPDGNDDWYITPVDFELSATDLESGVKEINYRIDGGSWQTISFTNTANLAPNPSFETLDAGTSTGVADWESTIVDPEVTVTPDTTEYAPGYSTTSVKIDATAGTWHGINNKIAYVPATPFDNMSASVWMKVAGVPGISNFKVYALLNDSSSVELAESDSITGTQGWTRLAVNFTVTDSNAIGVYLDIGHTGPGIVYADAVNINSSTFETTTEFTVATDNEDHTVEFYSVDNLDNTETYSCTSPVKNCIEFKLDQTPPSNWRDSAAVRSQGGAEHELYVFSTVDDVTSGLSTNTNKNMYKIEPTDEFGRYTDLLHCNTPWLNGTWVDLEDAVLIDGTPSAILKTQKIDFCNSDWKVCKDVRFYAEDIAGNSTTKDLCINGPWIKVRGGAVRANSNIDMLAESPDEENTDGLVEVGGNIINFFSTSTGWKVLNSPTPSTYGYQELYDLTSETKTSIATDGDLTTDTDVFEISGDYDATNVKIPSDYDNDTFDQIVFVDGNLTISSPLEVDETSTALFVVSGNVNIAKNVTDIAIGIIADGDFNTAYDLEEGKTANTLTMNGIFVANKMLLKRTLQGTNNNSIPSEEIYYEPKYLIQLKQFFKNNSVLWSYEQ